MRGPALWNRHHPSLRHPASSASPARCQLSAGWALPSAQPHPAALRLASDLLTDATLPLWRQRCCVGCRSADRRPPHDPQARIRPPRPQAREARIITPAYLTPAAAAAPRLSACRSGEGSNPTTDLPPSLLLPAATRQLHDREQDGHPEDHRLRCGGGPHAPLHECCMRAHNSFRLTRLVPPRTAASQGLSKHLESAKTLMIGTPDYMARRHFTRPFRRAASMTTASAANAFVAAAARCRAAVSRLFFS